MSTIWPNATTITVTESWRNKSIAQPPIFLDTAFTYALFNTRDQWHSKAVAWWARYHTSSVKFITTQQVLIEIGNGLSGPRFRQAAAEIIQDFSTDPSVEIVDLSADLFFRALELYRNRPDKDWGMTDCISFTVMRDRGVNDALTTDEHFRQAGFNALLLDDQR